jgi:hypothetical protein
MEVADFRFELSVNPEPVGSRGLFREEAPLASHQRHWYWPLRRERSASFRFDQTIMRLLSVSGMALSRRRGRK